MSLPNIISTDVLFSENQFNNANKIFKPLLKYPQNKTTLWYEN